MPETKFHPYTTEITVLHNLMFIFIARGRE